VKFYSFFPRLPKGFVISANLMPMNQLKRFLLFSLAMLFMTQFSYAQLWSALEKKELAKKEDSLKGLSKQIVFGSNPAISLRADSNFVRTFVRALKTRNSFYYPFDSVAISKLYAPDSSFRIFTWQWQKDEYVYLQRGAIQMRTADGSLKLFPLHDASMFTGKPEDSARTNNNWIGAIYYKIIQKQYNGKQYYTLLGFDDYSIASNKKWMDVLSFQNGVPVFGGPFFSFKNDTTKKPIQSRFSIEYKKEAKTFFNYDEENDMVVFDHLISETEEPSKKETLVPDGDYEGFKWMNGQWVHVDKVFNFKLKDGEFPIDEKLLDDAGNPDDDKLQKASEKNLQKKQVEKKPAVKKPGGGTE
jgi:hypothetical protein